jgi:hypothetical protein
MGNLALRTWNIRIEKPSTNGNNFLIPAKKIMGRSKYEDHEL